MKKQFIIFLFFLLFTTCQNTDELLLHVPSPNWEDQIVYFIMTDRFYDGNPGNNELGMGEYNPDDGSRYNGGDLAGILQQLDYIEELGATAIWITPPVLNQWWNPQKDFTGYHGYWASHFEKVDPHYGNLEDYKRLSDGLHRRGMYLIQDVVTNHTGDFFRYEGGYDSTDVTKYYVNYGAPEQPPFDQNDPRNAEHLKAGIYHFTPVIPDFKDPDIRETHQLSNLDDINTSNPEVIKALIRAYQYWIEVVGVDAYRFDTAIYVDHEFWHRFLHGGQDSVEGIYPFAKNLGKDGFYTFGEAWIPSQQFDDGGEQELKTYLGSPAKPEMSAVLNFPFQLSTMRVFGDGEPTAQLAYRIKALQNHFPESTSLVNFIDNHDMARFRSVASEESYQQAMLFMMTQPGMPVIYQGTEQGEKEVREPLFDKLDAGTDAFQFVKKMITFRKEHAVTRKGQVTPLKDSKSCPGLLLYRLKKDEEELFVAFNTKEYALLTGDILVSADENIHAAEEVLSLRGGSEIMLEKGKIRLLRLPAKEGLVFKIKKGTPSETVQEVRGFNASGAKIVQNSLPIRGTAPGADSVFILLDGNLDHKISTTIADDLWEAELYFKNEVNGPHFWQAMAVKDGDISLSDKILFTLELPEMERAVAFDPVGDDQGPGGTYLYPTDPTFSRQMDLRSVKAYTTGNNLRLEVEMTEPLSTIWNPFNGFDHLLLLVYIDVPGKKGISALPHMNLQLPEGQEWDIGVTANGWHISMFRSEGSHAHAYGQAISQKPFLTTLPGQNTIQLSFSAASLGNPETLNGAKIYLYTWDGAGDENGLRPLEKEAKGFTFGGGEEGDPKYMDAVELELKNEN